MDQGRQGRDQVDTAVVQDVRGQRRAAPTSCARLQSWQLSPHACNTGADQGLVADELEGEADQDRPTDAMSSSKWRRSPSHDKCSRRFCGCSRNYGRSHHPRQHEAFDCHAFKRNRQEECVQMPVKIARSNPSTIVRAARAAGSQPYLPRPGFQGRCKIATLHAGFGVIRGMSDYSDTAASTRNKVAGGIMSRRFWEIVLLFAIALSTGACERVERVLQAPDGINLLKNGSFEDGVIPTDPTADERFTAGPNVVVLCDGSTRIDHWVASGLGPLNPTTCSNGKTFNVLDYVANPDHYEPNVPPCPNSFGIAAQEGNRFVNLVEFFSGRP